MSQAESYSFIKGVVAGIDLTSPKASHLSPGKGSKFVQHQNCLHDIEGNKLILFFTL
jgi:hypothetical protein